MTGGRKNTLDQRVIVELREEIIRLKDVVAEITFENLEIKKKLENACRGGKRHEITLYDIHGTVMKAVEWAGYSRSWYYSQMDFSPLLDKKFYPFVVRDEEEWMVVSFKKRNSMISFMEIAYTLIDENLAYLSPSTVYRRGFLISLFFYIDSGI